MAMAAGQRAHPATYLTLAVTSVLLAFTFMPLAAGDPLDQICGDSGNYTANSTYQANIQSLATTLPRTTSSSQKLFATSVFGDSPDMVYALALCRGDINASACSDCIATAFTDAQQLCAFNKDVTIFYDPCLLRYSNQDFISFINGGGGEFIILEPMLNESASGKKYHDVASVVVNDGRGNNFIILMNIQNVTSPFSVFDDAVGVLLNATADYAANSSRRFGTAVEGFKTFDTKNPTLYGLAQCTSDMAPADCRTCLSGILQPRLKYFSGKQGGSILGVRCNYRYEQYSFFNGVPLLQLPEPSMGAPALVSVTQSTIAGGRGNGRVLVIILPTIVMMLIMLVICSFLWRKKRKQARKPSVLYSANSEDIGSVDLLIIDLPTLQTATDNFDAGKKLGEGGFGEVYKILIKKSELDWPKRFMIINGIVQGLQYLHEESQLKIVHRDLKASNVLLDSDFNPKVSDFGLAKLFRSDQSQYVTNRVVGTYGYMAPEYAMRGHYSIKSDVFSFGILILEIVTGRRNGDSYDSEQYVHLLSSVWEHWTMGAVEEIMDSSLSSYSSVDQMLKCIHIGLLCVQHNPADRPMMSTVNLMLSSSSMPRQAPARPAFCFQRSSVNSRGRGSLQSTCTSLVSENEISISELEAR